MLKHGYKRSSSGIGFRSIFAVWNDARGRVLVAFWIRLWENELWIGYGFNCMAKHRARVAEFALEQLERPVARFFGIR